MANKLLLDRVINVALLEYENKEDVETDSYGQAVSKGRLKSYMFIGCSKGYTSKLEVPLQTIEEVRNQMVLWSTLPNFAPAGIKPSITIGLKQVGYGTATQITLSISNLAIGVNLNKYDAILVEAGYSHTSIDGAARKAETEFIFFPVFSSYVESPNPNGRTVFTGIVGGYQDGSELGNFARTFALRKARWNLKSLVDEVSRWLQLKPPEYGIPSLALTQETLTDQETSPQGTVRDGYVLLQKSNKLMVDWVLQLCQALSNELVRKYGKEHAFISTFYDGQFIIQSREKYDARIQLQIDQGIAGVKLSRVSDVNVQGGILNVTAPWNPKVKPMGIVIIKPEFFRGRLNPRVLYVDDANGLLSKDGICRVISSDVSFDTTGTQNQMKLLLVPIRSDAVTYATVSSNIQQPVRTITEYFAQYNEDVQQMADWYNLDEIDIEELKKENKKKGTKLAVLNPPVELEEPSDWSGTSSGEPPVKMQDPALKYYQDVRLSASRSPNEWLQGATLWGQTLVPVLMSNAPDGTSSFSDSYRMHQLLRDAGVGTQLLVTKRRAIDLAVVYTPVHDEEGNEFTRRDTVRDSVDLRFALIDVVLCTTARAHSRKMIETLRGRPPSGSDTYWPGSCTSLLVWNEDETFPSLSIDRSNYMLGGPDLSTPAKVKAWVEAAMPFIEYCIQFWAGLAFAFSSSWDASAPASDSQAYTYFSSAITIKYLHALPGEYILSEARW